MNLRKRLLFSLLPCLLLCVSGCGDRVATAPVSGTVTVDGTPVENVLVIFSPMVQGDNHFPGPYSSGVTDSNGRFTLKTRSGQNGAVIGNHAIGFTWADVSPDALGLIQERLANVEMSDDPEAERSRLEREFRETREKIESRPFLDPMIKRTFEVSSEGSDAADFELGAE
ncbi:MAG: Ig-like domain-containing protein [Planctomycetota bacterium]